MKAPTPDGVPVITAVYAGIVVPLANSTVSFQLRCCLTSIHHSGKYKLTLTHEAENLTGRKYHIPIDFNILHDLSIDSGRELDSLPVVVHSGADKHGTDGRELVKCLCVEKLPAILLVHLEESAA